MNQLIFTDLGVIVALGANLNESAMSQIGKAVQAWVEGANKVIVLPVADWEIVDKRTPEPWTSRDMGSRS